MSRSRRRPSPSGRPMRGAPGAAARCRIGPRSGRSCRRGAALCVPARSAALRCSARRGAGSRGRRPPRAHRGRRRTPRRDSAIYRSGSRGPPPPGRDPRVRAARTARGGRTGRRDTGCRERARGVRHRRRSRSGAPRRASGSFPGRADRPLPGRGPAGARRGRTSATPWSGSRTRRRFRRARAAAAPHGRRTSPNRTPVSRRGPLSASAWPSPVEELFRISLLPAFSHGMATLQNNYIRPA